MSIVNRIFLVVIVLLSSCSSKKEDANKPEKEEHSPNTVELSQEQYRTVGVKMGRVESINLNNYIKATGSVAVPPQDLMSITSAYGGTIRFTNVIEGKYVKKGELIATIENPEFAQVQQDFLESSSQLSYLQQNLTRQQELVRENIAARKSLQQAQSEYSSMEARVEGLKAKLRILNINPSSLRSGNLTSKANIYAPSDGYITHVYSNAGKYIGSNELLADMANTHNIMVTVKVFEKDMSKVKPGQQIRFQATSDTMQQMATVFLIGKDIDADRTVQVHAKVNTQTSTQLIPGMFINAIIGVGTSYSPALPEKAIVSSGGKNYIFILDNELKEVSPRSDVNENGKAKEEIHVVFKKIEVSIGVTEGGYTAVTLPGNFDMGSDVVTVGAYDLLAKMNNIEEEE